MAAPQVYHLDANVLLRFLLNDHKDHSPKASKLIEAARNGDVVLEVSAVTASELFYALRTSYGFDRPTAAKTLAAVLNTSAFHLPERKIILESLARVQSKNVDFGDAYLASLGADSGHSIASFDRDFDRFTDIKRHEP